MNKFHGRNFEREYTDSCKWVTFLNFATFFGNEYYELLLNGERILLSQSYICLRRACMRTIIWRENFRKEISLVESGLDRTQESMKTRYSSVQCMPNI